MRENLIQYVNLLFAGAADSDDVRQEILQNTLDRYDDLISQGKAPEAAYRLAISGIGDVNEIVGNAKNLQPGSQSAPVTAHNEPGKRRIAVAFAIAFYILCPVPVILLGSIGYGTIGVTLMFLLIAAATALLIMNPAQVKITREETADSPRQELKKSVGSIVWAIGFAVYLILSFLTGAWFITWILFPIIGSVQGLINAIFDLKEAKKHEK